MNKDQKVAIEQQQYIPKVVSMTCGNCKHLASTFILPKWMRDNPIYSINEYGIEKTQCGIGKFDVKRTGICIKHEPS